MLLTNPQNRCHISSLPPSPFHNCHLSITAAFTYMYSQGLPLCNHECITTVTNHWNVLLQTAFHQSHQTCVSLLPRPAYQIPRAIRTSEVSKNVQVGTMCIIGKNYIYSMKILFAEKRKKGKVNNYFSPLSTPTVKPSSSKPSGNYKVALMLEWYRSNMLTTLFY